MGSTAYAFTQGLDYASILAASEKVAWTVDAIFRDQRFDASKPMVPASWVRTQDLDFLTAQEQLTLNHSHGARLVGPHSGPGLPHSPGTAHAQPLPCLQLCPSVGQL